MGLQRNRLWALKNSPDSDVIFHEVGTELPTLFNKKKDALAFQKMDAWVQAYTVLSTPAILSNSSTSPNGSLPTASSLLWTTLSWR